MILSTDEIAWVKERMKIYDIKYQEIYDELLDHILTAIEKCREDGNTKEVAVLFQDVVDEHFNGYVGIEALAVSEQKIYQKNIRSMFFQRMKKRFNWQTLVIAVVLLTAAYKLPNAKPVHVFFMIGMLVLAISPVIYAFALLAGKVKTIKGKSSLLKTHIISQAAVPIFLLNGFLYIPNLFDGFNDRKDFYAFNTPPIVLMALLLFLLVTNVSYIQLCREIIAKKLNRL